MKWDKSERILLGKIFGGLCVVLSACTCVYKVLSKADEVEGVLGVLQLIFATIISEPFSWAAFAIASFMAFVCWDDIMRVVHYLKRLGNIPAENIPDQSSKTPAFQIRAIHSDPFPLIAGLGEARAKLAIKNVSGKLLKRCSVRLMSAHILMNGEVFSAPGCYPSISQERGETFNLRWAESERPISGGRLLDIPSDGTERIAECLSPNGEEQRGAKFCSALPMPIGQLAGIGGDWWWKVVVKVASEDGPACELALIAACIPDRGAIRLDNWSPLGDRVLEAQKQERLARKIAAEKP